MQSGTASRVKLDKWLDYVIAAMCIGMAFYHLAFAMRFLQMPIEHQNTFLFFSLAIIFLVALKAKPKRWPLLVPLLLLTLITTGYIKVFYVDLEMRAGFSTDIDLVIGVILILLVIYGAWLGIGPTLPIMASIAIAYVLFGSYLPPPFQSFPISFTKAIGNLSVGLKGIYGLLLNIAATYIVLFMIFAGLIEATGVSKFFNQVGKLVGRWFQSGPAMAAVITSALMGSINGSAGANVAITGSYTIPAMKKVGYNAEQAGGIEAAASTGGPIIPPVMGATAFVMAAFTGTPYYYIILIAAFPAVLYMLGCGIYVELQARRMGVQPEPETVDYKELLFRLPQFIIPFIVITVLFMKGHSPMYVGFWSCITIVAVSFLMKRTRPSLSHLVKGIVSGASLASKVGANCACISMVLATVLMSGMGVRLPHIIADLTGGNFALLLILTAVLSIILGCGLPPTAAYILVVMVLAPIIMHAGVSMLAAHFFVFLLANFAFITPPIAVAALFASQISGSSYLKTAFESSKVGIAGFILPILFIFCPAMLFDFSQPFSSALMVISSILGVLTLQIVFTGYFLTGTNLMRRCVFLICPFVLLAYIFTSNLLFFIAGLGILMVGVSWQAAARRRKDYVMAKAMQDTKKSR